MNLYSETYFGLRGSRCTVRWWGRRILQVAFGGLGNTGKSSEWIINGICKQQIKARQVAVLVLQIEVQYCISETMSFCIT